MAIKKKIKNELNIMKKIRIKILIIIIKITITIITSFSFINIIISILETYILWRVSAGKERTKNEQTPKNSTYLLDSVQLPPFH